MKAKKATTLPELRSTDFGGRLFVELEAAAAHLRAADIDLNHWPRIYRLASEVVGSVPQRAIATQHAQYMERLMLGLQLPVADHPGDIGDQVVRVMRGLEPQPIELYLLESELHKVLGRARASRREPWHDELAAILGRNPRVSAKAACAQLAASGHGVLHPATVANVLARMRGQK
jgi:hypothetical protein